MYYQSSKLPLININIPAKHSTIGFGMRGKQTVFVAQVLHLSWCALYRVLCRISVYLSAVDFSLTWRSSIASDNGETEPVGTFEGYQCTNSENVQHFML